jgi:hypothetical protein
MKTHVLVTITHPDDSISRSLVDFAVSSIFDAIGGNTEEGWGVTTSSPRALQIKELALAVALRYHLSDFDGDKTSDETFSAIGESEDIVVWEPFERWESYEITNSVWNLAHDIETTFNEALGLEESE